MTNGSRPAGSDVSRIGSGQVDSAHADAPLLATAAQSKCFATAIQAREQAAMHAYRAGNMAECDRQNAIIGILSNLSSRGCLSKDYYWLEEEEIEKHVMDFLKADGRLLAMLDTNGKTTAEIEQQRADVFSHVMKKQCKNKIELGRFKYYHRPWLFPCSRRSLV